MAMKRQRVVDPQHPSGMKLVYVTETTSRRFTSRSVLHPYRGELCELCWRSTERAIAIDTLKIYRRLPDTSAEPAEEVQATPSMRSRAHHLARDLAKRYRRLLREEGPYAAARMLSKYCDIASMRNGTAQDDIEAHIEDFREQAEHTLFLQEIAREGCLLGKPQVPAAWENPQTKPSRLYCEHHNPRRSDAARRNYQRDRRYQDVFDHLTREIRSGHSIESYRDARKEAYEALYKQRNAFERHEGSLQHCGQRSGTLKKIHRLRKSGVTNQAEIARRLGLTRQAISAALKRARGT